MRNICTPENPYHVDTAKIGIPAAFKGRAGIPGTKSEDEDEIILATRLTVNACQTICRFMNS